MYVMVCFSLEELGLPVSDIFSLCVTSNVIFFSLNDSVYSCRSVIGRYRYQSVRSSLVCENAKSSNINRCWPLKNAVFSTGTVIGFYHRWLAVLVLVHTGNGTGIGHYWYRYLSAQVSFLKVLRDVQPKQAIEIFFISSGKGLDMIGIYVG